MRIIVLGVGATGSRAARQLVSLPGLEELLLIDQDVTRAEEAARSLGAPARAATINALRLESRLERFRGLCEGASLVVLAAPVEHVDLAEICLQAGAHVVSVADDVDTVEELLELDRVATDLGRNVVVGAGFSPGLTCLLSRHAAEQLDVIDEIHVAKFGTGGPQCALAHHRALRSDALDWCNQYWVKRRGGSGRELCWFPDPVGGRDCYQAALPDILLMLSVFPTVVRASARVAATRRDRLTKWLPMMRRPHPEGTLGAVRVEARGWRETTRTTIVLGALDRPAVAAGTVAAVAGMWAMEGRFIRSGAGGLAQLVDKTVPVLAELAERGVKAAVFDGVRQDEVSFSDSFHDEVEDHRVVDELIQ